jgi:hypothetical protein
VTAGTVRVAELRCAHRATIETATGVSFAESPVPDCAYFRASEVAPTIDGEVGAQVIHITNGYGRHRVWGAPRCHSSVELVAPDVIQVSMSWGNKHAWGSQDYWFIRERGGLWARRTAHHRRVQELLASATPVAQATEGGV